MKGLSTDVLLYIDKLALSARGYVSWFFSIAEAPIFAGCAVARIRLNNLGLARPGATFWWKFGIYWLILSNTYGICSSWRTFIGTRFGTAIGG